MISRKWVRDVLVSRATRSIALASALTLGVVATAFASFPISARGGWDTATGVPGTCSSTEWLFVINGISGGPAPDSIVVTFDNGSADFSQTFLNKPGSTAQYSLAVSSTNATWLVVGATAVLQDGTTYNNFVLSHGSCAGAPTGGGTGGGGTTPPPPSATPELDSIALFGVGLLGVGGYAMTRIRARRRS